METNNLSKVNIERIGEILIDTSRPLKERFRALFTLRNIGGESSIRCIEKSFSDPSALLKHECAYCLGQMQDSFAIPKLIFVLEDSNQEPIVRHEAAEALAAIGDKSCHDVLKKYLNDPCLELAETCQLAIRKLKESPETLKTIQTENPYRSEDPAPPLSKSSYNSVQELENILLDNSRSLYERYQAMFSLRNIGTKVSALSLAKGLASGTALFRHEIAYVLGQMQNDATVKQLAHVLFDKDEHEMVRHECAEALGSIATEECMEILYKYLTDEKRVVRESCEIALDMCEYENNEEFQYADALLKPIL